MKTFRTIAAAVFFFALAINTSAIAKTHHTAEITAQSAADANRRMQNIEQSLLDEGFKRASVDEQQINYFAVPAAPYAWGHLVYIYTRIVPGHFQMVERVQVTTEVTNTGDGFSFPSITVRDLLSQ